MIFAFYYTVDFLVDIFLGAILIGVMITNINTDITLGLNTLPHKLPSLDSIKLNAQMIMRSPIFVFTSFVFTTYPLFNNVVFKLFCH